MTKREEKAGVCSAGCVSSVLEGALSSDGHLQKVTRESQMTGGGGQHTRGEEEVLGSRSMASIISKP